MNKLIISSLKEVNSLEDINKALLKVFKEAKKASPDSKFGYVAGIITAKGKDKSPFYIARLAKYTEHLRKNNSFHIFSATDIFTQEIYQKTNAFNIPGSEFKIFWRDVLKMGFVTDIFMTPEWDIPNSGAEDEHITAKKLGIKIHYVDPVDNIEKIVNDI